MGTFSVAEGGGTVARESQPSLTLQAGDKPPPYTHLTLAWRSSRGGRHMRYMLTTPMMFCPASTCRVSPVTFLARSEQR